MDIAIILLGILYLKGRDVGNALAICAIVEGVLVLVDSIFQYFRDDEE